MESHEVGLKYLSKRMVLLVFLVAVLAADVLAYIFCRCLFRSFF